MHSDSLSSANLKIATFQEELSKFSNTYKIAGISWRHQGIPVPLRGDKANGVHRRLTFTRPVKDIEAMEIEV